MQKNQLVALLCAFGVILIAFSMLVHISNVVSTIILIIACALIGFGFVKYISKPKEEK